MSDKYCPAGKINCMHYHAWADGVVKYKKECQAIGSKENKVRCAEEFECCPFESKQKPIKDWKERAWEIAHSKFHDGDILTLSDKDFILAINEARKEAGFDD